MKTLLISLGGLLCLSLAGSTARANGNSSHYHPGCWPTPAGWCYSCAPCGGNAWGTAPGRTIPAFPIPPFHPSFSAPQVGFPTHPYARSPRDFFMTD